MKRSFTNSGIPCLIAAILLSLSLPVHAQEFRGIWVDAFHPGFRTPDESTAMVNKISDANLNAIFVQVRKRGDAYYNSALVPKTTGIASDYDPLADVITKAHAKGIEVHAWLNLLEVWNVQKFKDGKAPADHVYAQHPEWMTKDTRGREAWSDGRVFLDPGHLDVQAYLVKVVADLATNYEVDGINLGDIGYPTAASGHNQASTARFKADAGEDAVASSGNAAWNQWREMQITNLVKSISAEVGKIKPKLRLSASVRPTIDDSRDNYKQDWPKWLVDGLLDSVIPMNLMPDRSKFDVSLVDCRTRSVTRHLYLGQGTWLLGAEDAISRLGVTRQSGYPGFVLYSYATLLGPSSGKDELIRQVVSTALKERVPTPEMPWKPRQ